MINVQWVGIMARDTQSVPESLNPVSLQAEDRWDPPLRVEAAAEAEQMSEAQGLPGQQVLPVEWSVHCYWQAPGLH